MHLISTLPSQIHAKPGRIIIDPNCALRSQCALPGPFDPHASTRISRFRIEIPALVRVETYK